MPLSTRVMQRTPHPNRARATAHPRVPWRDERERDGRERDGRERDERERRRERDGRERDGWM